MRKLWRRILSFTGAAACTVLALLLLIIKAKGGDINGLDIFILLAVGLGAAYDFYLSTKT